MLDLPLGDRFLGRFSWTPPQGAVLVEERHRGPRIAHEASIHVVAWRGRCCANTRSDKWHPLLAIGIQCCVYLRDCRDWRLDPGVEERDPQKYLPSCFWDKSRARLASAAMCPASSPRRRSRIGAGTPSTTRGRLTSRRCANPGACRPASRDHARVLSPGSLCGTYLPNHPSANSLERQVRYRAV